MLTATKTHAVITSNFKHLGQYAVLRLATGLPLLARNGPAEPVD
jgi:hypothetical protein